MNITLDHASLDLLGALHLGCRASFVEQDGGAIWEVKHRIFADARSKWSRVRQEEPVPTDVTYGHDGPVDMDTAHRVDRWSGPEREHPLDDGLRLIRAGLAQRKGEMLELTLAGHGVGQTRHGDGAGFGYKGSPFVPQTTNLPAFEVVEMGEPIEPFARIAAGREMAIERNDRHERLVLSVACGPKTLSTHQTFGAARTMIAMLGDAGKSSAAVEAEFGSNLILTIHDKSAPASLRIEGEWDYADVPLPAPLHRLFREYLRENVKADGGGISMRPVDVAWHSFDATWDQVIP